MNSELNVAVHALVYLNHKGGSLSSEAIAENVCTHPARVRKVLSRLKKAGLVQTKEGAEGGYSFCGDAQAVTLEQVAQALGITFVEACWRSGDVDMKCLVASGMGAVMDDVYRQMNRACAQYLQTVTLAQIDRRIFLNKERI